MRPKPEVVFKINKGQPIMKFDHESGDIIGRVMTKYPESMNIFAMQGLHAMDMLDAIDRRRGPEAVRKAIEIFDKHGGITKDSKLELGQYFRATNPKAKGAGPKRV